MLLDSLTGWENIRFWYRDTIRRYLQVITNSPLFIGLIFKQLIGVHIMLSFESFDSPNWRTEQLFHHETIFDFPTRQKCPEKTSETCERPGAALAPWLFLGLLNLGVGFRIPSFRWQPLGFFKVPFWGQRTWKKNTHTDTWWRMNIFLDFHVDEKFANNAWIILCVGGQNQPMGNWWFRLVFWIRGIPLWNNLRGTPRIPNHQPKPTIND